jgi:hypothetical protein
LVRRGSGLNLSVLGGWWCEGHRQDNGWAIGAGEEVAWRHDLTGRFILCAGLSETFPFRADEIQR